MSNNIEIIPDGFIVFISGVPGVGKTTISYELLKKYNKFRIIEETDLIREVLRGYNEFLNLKFGTDIMFALDKINITDHNKLLSLDEAKTQCKIMKSSFKNIIKRQQRKGIASIINGVHIIPEILIDIAENIVFINLYVTNENKIKERIKKRNPNSYMLSYIPSIFQTNNDLCANTKELIPKYNNVFNVNVTDLDESETVEVIINCIRKMQMDS